MSEFVWGGGGPKWCPQGFHVDKDGNCVADTPTGGGGGVTQPNPCPIKADDPFLTYPESQRAPIASWAVPGTVYARYNGTTCVCPIGWTMKANANLPGPGHPDCYGAWCEPPAGYCDPSNPNPNPNPNPQPPLPGPGPSTGECCSEATLCDGLTGILDEIAKSQKDIADILKGDFGDCSKFLTKCEDELNKLIQSKIDAELKTFARCQRLASEGLCGSSEFAQNCGKYALQCGGNECYEPGVGNVTGRCKTCEKEPCCCKDGKCVPCDEQPTQPSGYVGWCDSVTGIAYVTRKDGEPPSEFSRPVAIADTEEVALLEAEEYCRSGKPIVTPPTIAPDIPATDVSFNCDLQGYADGSNLERIQANNAEQQVELGTLRAIEAIEGIGFAGVTLENIGKLGEGLLQGYFGVQPQLERVAIRSAASLIGCDSPEMRQALYALTAFGNVQKYSGADLSQLTAPFMYAIQSRCRTKFLDPDKAIAAYLANAVGDKDLDTLWAIHGLCPESVAWYKEAARAKPLPLDLMTMKLRKVISEADYFKSMRQLGYTNQQDSKNLLALRQQLPTMSDIIRFMVRDADDATLVAKFGLDSNFTQKYQKQLKDWSEQQGVSETLAKYAWRSHWTIPSPTQLFSFWRRLRKDKAFGGEAKLWQDISDALIQQDILPYWHDHFKAVSYLPLGRVDIRRAFNIGAIQESDLEGLYQQLGYSDDDALKQKQFAIRLRNEAVPKNQAVKLWVEGLIDRAEVVNRLTKLGFPQTAIDDGLGTAQYHFDSSVFAAAFAAGRINRNQFINKLTTLGVDAAAAASIADKIGYKVSPAVVLQRYQAGVTDRGSALNELQVQGVSQDVAQTVMDDADAGLQISKALNCQRAIKRRYVSGDIDRQGAENALIGAGLVQQRAAQIVGDWACELSAQGKNATIPRLCNWLARGAINPIDFLRRAQNLGYNADDAALIMDDCLISVNAKRNAEAKRMAKEDAAAAAAKQRKLDRLAAQTQQALNQQARAVKAARDTKSRREKQLLSAADKIIKKCGCPLEKAYAYAIDNNRRIQTEYALNKDESLQAMITAADAWDGTSFDDLTESVNLAASLLQTTETELADSLA